MQPSRLGREWVLHGQRARRQFEEALETSNGDLIPQPLVLSLSLTETSDVGDPLDALVRNLDMLRRRLDPDRELGGLCACLAGDPAALPLLRDLVEAVGRRFPLTAGARRPWPCVIRGEQRLALQREVREIGFVLADEGQVTPACAPDLDQLGVGPGAISLIGGWRFEAPAGWRDYRAAIDAGLYPIVEARQGGGEPWK